MQSILEPSVVNIFQCSLGENYYELSFSRGREKHGIDKVHFDDLNSISSLSHPRKIYKCCLLIK